MNKEVLDRLTLCIRRNKRSTRCDECKYQVYLDCKDILLNELSEVIEEYKERLKP